MQDTTSPGIPAAAFPVELRMLTADELGAATAVLSHGMLYNPLHVKVFGANPAHRARRLSRFLGPLVAYVHSHGMVMGAFASNELVGVLGMIKPGHCRPGLSDRLRIARAILTAAPPTVLWRIHRWLAAWARNDPDKPHWHIGPLAVHPEHRRSGLGRRLMQYACRHLDTLGATAWLETDLEINVTFYRGFGFDLVRKEPGLGIPTWYMSRVPIPDGIGIGIDAAGQSRGRTGSGMGDEQLRPDDE